MKRRGFANGVWKDDVYVYAVKRTRLYLDDDLWTLLHATARPEGTTVSELVREALRERYLVKRDERRHAMQALVGMWEDHRAFSDVGGYIRAVRRDTRRGRLNNE